MATGEELQELIALGKDNQALAISRADVLLKSGAESAAIYLLNLVAGVYVFASHAERRKAAELVLGAADVRLIASPEARGRDGRLLSELSLDELDQLIKVTEKKVSEAKGKAEAIVGEVINDEEAQPLRLLE